MKLTRKEALIVGGAGVVGLSGAVFAWSGAVAWAVIALILLAMLSVGLQVIILRRIALRQASLDRVERKMDVVARRVVTESEALSAEIRRRAQ